MVTSCRSSGDMDGVPHLWCCHAGTNIICSLLGGKVKPLHFASLHLECHARIWCLEPQGKYPLSTSTYNEALHTSTNSKKLKMSSNLNNCERVLCSTGWLWTHSVAKSNFEVLILLLLSSPCYDYKNELPHSVYTVRRIEPRASRTLGKGSTDRATFLLLKYQCFLPAILIRLLGTHGPNRI